MVAVALAEDDANNPSELLLLLPWYATQTLSRRDMGRVEAALTRDPDLAREYALVQKEYAEAVVLNEDLGAPSAQSAQRLFQAIETERPPKSAWLQNFGERFASIFADFSARFTPRAMVTWAALGVCALCLQTAIIATVWVRNNGAIPFEAAAMQNASPALSWNAGSKSAGHVLIRFHAGTSDADIADLLNRYRAKIITSNEPGLYEIAFTGRQIPNIDADPVIAQLRAEPIVNFGAAAR